MASGSAIRNTQPIAFQSATQAPESGIDAHYAPIFSWMLRSGLWSELSQSEKALLVTLRMKMNRNGETIAGAKRLAVDTGMSRRSVFRSLDRLRQCGLIESAIVGRGDLETNHYRVFDAIPLVVAQARIGIIRVSITPGTQTAFMEALKQTVAAGMRTAKIGKLDLAMGVLAQVNALAEKPIGSGVLSCAVVSQTGEAIAVYRTNLFVANDAPSQSEHGRKQEVERQHIVAALHRFRDTQSSKPKLLRPSPLHTVTDEQTETAEQENR